MPFRTLLVCSPPSPRHRRAIFAPQAGWPVNRGPKGAKVGAGEGNRTLVISLEGCCSTIELHPHSDDRDRGSGIRTKLLLIPMPDPCFPIPAWWRGLDSNQRRLSQRIYSPSPLATRAPLRKFSFP